MAKHSRPRIVVIGAGAIANRCHLPCLKHLADQKRCEIAAICDLDTTRAATTARDFGVSKIYTDFEAMLRIEKPTGALVLTKMQNTASVAGAILRRGIPVLMEKPPGSSARECRQLIRDARTGRASGYVAFNRRFCPVLVAGRDAIVARGRIKGASARMMRASRTDEEFFFGTGIHSLDALRFLGGEIESIDTDRRILVKGERPAFTLMIGYVNGAAGTLSIRPQSGANLEHYDLFGENCTAMINAGSGWELDMPASLAVYHDKKLLRLADPLGKYRRFRSALHAAACGGWYRANERFVASLAGGAKLSPTVEECLPSVEIAEAVQAGRSWKRRR